MSQDLSDVGAKVREDLLLEMYLRMLRIRRFEEEVLASMARGETASGHLAIGQEAAEVGACIPLRTDDYQLGTHRSHGHVIAKGADLGGLLAELFGNTNGNSKGRGGSMHLADFSVGAIGESSIVGGTLPLAVGAGFSAKMRGTDQVALVFFGDGASNTGAFHESLNLAAVWGLPVVFLCENNLYAVTEPYKEYLSIPDIAQRSVSYGVPGNVVDGQDVVAVYDVVKEAVERARRGEGPSLVETKTYRLRDHAEFGAMGDRLSYRTAEEIESWRLRDPLVVFNELSTARGLRSEQLKQIEHQVAKEIQAALEFARSGEKATSANAMDDLFVNSIQ